MKRFLIIIGAGLLPLWISIIYVIVHGALLPHAPAYWDEAQDLIVLGMALSLVTLLVLLALIDVVERRRRAGAGEK